MRRDLLQILLFPPSHVPAAPSPQPKTDFKLAARELHKAPPCLHPAPTAVLAITAAATSSCRPPSLLPRSCSWTPGPATRQRPRKRGRGRVNSGARRHGGGRFPSSKPASPAAMSPPCPGGPGTSSWAASNGQSAQRTPEAPASRDCSPWWRMAVDSPKQIRARRVAPRMAATTAEENADVNTQPFIGRRRLGGSYGLAAGVELSDAARRRARTHLVVNPLGAGASAL